ncbi:hypothetical protein SD77_2457 [Bacillus badius]|uniref:Ribose 5-phosphate isomerase B n=1 Tax=Bacillus badius TaxID=1455 RepID=A0ABR5AZ46_BACBA|nr:hypothetical protein SD78_2083 [Bacillus badius]KIL80003.1 hypothetical protein SD77_2457 [Bacillus badius]
MDQWKKVSEEAVPFSSQNKSREKHRRGSCRIRKQKAPGLCLADEVRKVCTSRTH